MRSKYKILLLVAVLALSAGFTIQGQSTYTPYTFTTIAGNPGFGTNDGMNRGAAFTSPRGVTVDSGGVVYIADSGNSSIRQAVHAGTNWVVTTIAGQSGVSGSADGTNFNAQFSSPGSLAINSVGIIFVADSANSTVRQLVRSGTNWVVTTVAGLAHQSGTNDGLGQDARFSNPSGIAVDLASNVYVADTANHAIRLLTKVSTNWTVTTIAGTPGTSGTNDGIGSAAQFYNPYGITVDNLGNVFVADLQNYTIRKLTLTGTNWTVTTVAGAAGSPGTVDGVGSSARLLGTFGMKVDASDNVYFSDSSGDTIRVLSPSGTNWQVRTLAGLAQQGGFSDGNGTNARFNYPTGVAVDTFGNVFVADMANHLIRKLTNSSSQWAVTTLAGQINSAGGADGTNGAAQFFRPANVAVDTNGVVYVADSANNTIRRIAQSGTNWIVSTLAGLAGAAGKVDAVGTNARFASPYGVTVGTDGNIYVADRNNGAIRQVTPAGAVTTLSVKSNLSPFPLRLVYDVAADNSGNLFVADAAASTIVKVSPQGINWAGTTIAGLPNSAGSADGTNGTARFNAPQGVAVDAAGNVYVADTGNQTIRKITPVGTNWVVTTFAGSPTAYGTRDGTNGVAQFSDPSGVGVDSGGNVYITDFSDELIRKITPQGTNGVVTTAGGAPYSANRIDAAGKYARFSGPNGVTVDAHGNIFVADYYNNTIRMGWPENVPATIVAGGAGFGVSGGQFGFNLTGPPGQLVIVETSNDLVHWQPVWTNTFGTGPLSFLDPQTSSNPARFYRARTP